MVVRGCWEILLRFVRYDMWIILGIKKLPLEEDYLKNYDFFWPFYVIMFYQLSFGCHIMCQVILGYKKMFHSCLVSYLLKGKKIKKGG